MAMHLDQYEAFCLTLTIYSKASFFRVVWLNFAKKRKQYSQIH